jgi:Protein of unknown function (DUF3592)
MLGIMLIEIWERLRGYDKWVQTEATVESSSIEKTPQLSRGASVSYAYSSGDVLVWIDRQGAKQYADFNVPEGSVLYQLIGGERVQIRYNPNEPEKYYFPELLKSRVRAVVNGIKVAFLLLLLPLLAVLFGRVFR